MAAEGKDLDFARASRRSKKPGAGAARGRGDGRHASIRAKGSYHCIILGPAALDTKGGPVVDEHARVLSQSGEPIPGVYGAGNCVASPAGQAYWGAGGTIGVALTYRYIAAQDAVKRPSARSDARGDLRTQASATRAKRGCRRPSHLDFSKNIRCGRTHSRTGCRAAVHHQRLQCFTVPGDADSLRIRRFVMA